VAAKLKLTDEQVKRIRRRVRAGERVIDLADEFDVDRKTVWVATASYGGLRQKSDKGA
jgi:hypothetical protein